MIVLEGFISWCNTNQGFLSFILAFIALLTISITGILMRRSNKLSQENLSQAIELETQRSRPHLVIDIEHKDISDREEHGRWIDDAHYHAHLSVKNVGLTPAYKVFITVSPQINGVGADGIRPSGLLNNNISHIVPNRELVDCLCSSAEFNDKYESKIFEFHIKYEDCFGNDCSHDFVLDMEYAENVILSSITSSKGEPIEEKIHKALLNIDMTLSAIASNSNITATPTSGVLSKSHEELLGVLIEAHKNIPSDKTSIFYLSSVISGDEWGKYIIYHNGFNEREYIAEFDKLLSLERVGCIARVSSDSAYESSSFVFYITPEGFRYYDQIHQS